MRVIGLLLALVSLPVMAATEMTSQVYDVDYGSNPNDVVLIFLSNGRVAKVNPNNKALIEKVTSTKTTKNWLTITVDENRYIKKLGPGIAPLSAPSVNEEKNQMSTYVPTTIASMDIARKYFKEARYNPKDSQCFNRAHVWVYEWWKKHSLKSNKMIIFFSRTYIRRYNFEWWWHIAPLVHVMHEGKVVERMMDRKYTRGPLEIGKWTNIFMRNDATCQVITKYSDYADNPYLGECYLHRANMYTYQAADLQMLEAWNYTKDKFITEEVRGAYLEAFDERI